MVRVAYAVFYDGTKFNGFMGGAGSVYETLVRAFRQVLDLPDAESLDFTCASRTDPGVSALKNVIAVTLPRFVRPEELNSVLPDAVRVWAAAVVPDNFSARSAYARVYVYLKEYEGEDVDLMRKCAKLFEGTHDFSNFQIIDKDASPVTTIYSIEVQHLGNIIMFKFVGQGFRNKMIRKIVWTLVQVGLGRLSIDYVRDLIELKVRRTVPSAPAEGLLLVDVLYRECPNFSISERAVKEVVQYLRERLKILRSTVLSLDYAFSLLISLLIERVSKP